MLSPAAIESIPFQKTVSKETGLQVQDITPGVIKPTKQKTMNFVK